MRWKKVREGPSPSRYSETMYAYAFPIDEVTSVVHEVSYSDGSSIGSLFLVRKAGESLRILARYVEGGLQEEPNCKTFFFAHKLVEAGADGESFRQSLPSLQELIIEDQAARGWRGMDLPLYPLLGETVHSVRLEEPYRPDVAFRKKLDAVVQAHCEKYPGVNPEPLKSFCDDAYKAYLEMHDGLLKGDVEASAETAQLATEFQKRLELVSYSYVGTKFHGMYEDVKRKFIMNVYGAYEWTNQDLIAPYEEVVVPQGVSLIFGK